MGVGLVLSLFPGLGLLDMAFEEAGFCVVRGPDLLWGGDIKQFHPVPGRFDGIIGGPPCQCHSRLVHIVRAQGSQVAEDLIPEFARCVAEAMPGWFLMENVPAAPMPDTPGYAVSSLVLNNRWFGGVQVRKRLWVFGVRGGRRVDLSEFLDVALLERAEKLPAVMASGTFGPDTRSRMSEKQGPSWGTVAASLVAQGLPTDFLVKGESPFTADGAQRMVGNGVPLPMGRAVAGAVRRACERDGVVGA